MCGRAVWVRMSQEMLGGCMLTRDKTMVRTCYLGSDYAEDFGVRMYRRDETVRKGSWWVDVRATFGPDVTLAFGLVYVHCVCFGNRILQKTLGGFTNMLWETVWGG